MKPESAFAVACSKFEFSRVLFQLRDTAFYKIDFITVYPSSVGVVVSQKLKGANSKHQDQNAHSLSKKMHFCVHVFSSESTEPM